MSSNVRPALLTDEKATEIAERIARGDEYLDVHVYHASSTQRDDAGHLRAHAAAMRAGCSNDVGEKITRAWQVIAELCEGKRRWTMSVPARPDDDPDLILSSALGGARVALATLRAQLAAVTAERDALKDRARKAAQALVDEFGADGPMDCDDAAERAVTVGRTLRERATLAEERIAALAWWLAESPGSREVSAESDTVWRAVEYFRAKSENIARGPLPDVLDALRALRRQREGA